MTSILFIVQSDPYIGPSTNEAHDFILASTAYGHSAQVLFEGDGILQLRKQQKPTSGQKNTAKRIAAFEFFDVEPLWVCQSAVKKKQMSKNELIDNLLFVDHNEKVKLLSNADFIIKF